MVRWEACLDEQGAQAARQRGTRRFLSIFRRRDGECMVYAERPVFSREDIGVAAANSQRNGYSSNFVLHLGEINIMVVGRG